MELLDPSTFAVNTTGNQQITTVFPLNIPFLRAQLAQFGNGFTLEASGTIAQGATPQSVTFTLFFGIGTSVGQTSGISVVIPAGSFTASTTVAFKVVVDWSSQGNPNPNAGTPGHNVITAYINGIPIASNSGGNVMNFHQQIDTVGVPYNNQFTWMDANIGAAGPTVNGFISKFITYGIGP